jgi:hypothetical protein
MRILQIRIRFRIPNTAVNIYLRRRKEEWWLQPALPAFFSIPPARLMLAFAWVRNVKQISEVKEKPSRRL